MSLYSKDFIDFHIKDPKGFTIFTRINKKEAIFNMAANMPGEYEFLFINKRVK